MLHVPISNPWASHATLELCDIATSCNITQLVAWHLYVHALLLDYGSGSICHVAARKPSVSHIAHGTEHRWIQRLTIHMSSEILSSAWCHNSYAKSTSDVSSPLARVPKSCTRALNLLGLRDGVCVANRQNS